MVHEVLSPRVKDGYKTSLNTKTFLCEVYERLGGCLEQNIVHDLSVSQSKGVELVRKRKDNMEVLNGEEFLAPCLDPLLFLQELTLGTVSVPARVVGYPEVAALLALVDVSPEIRQSCTSLSRAWFVDEWRGSL